MLVNDEGETKGEQARKAFTLHFRYDTRRKKKENSIGQGAITVQL